MDAIKSCYNAYIQSEEYQKATDHSDELDKILESAEEMLPRKEYMVLEAAVRRYCEGWEEETFSAGFKFATHLWMEGVK